MSQTSSSRRRPSASRPEAVRKKPVRNNSVPEKPAPEKPARRKPLPTESFRRSARVREINTKRRGELAELEFVLKAANRGFGIARPYGDSERYDVILDARDLLPRRRVRQARVGRALLPADSRRKNTNRNEKKNANQPPKKTPRRKQSLEIPPVPADPSPPLWRVQVKCSTQLFEGLYRVNAHRRLNGRAVPYLPGEIDFFAVYIIPEDTWYIIPLYATFGVTTLLFRRRTDRRPGLYDAYREAWHLLRPKP